MSIQRRQVMQTVGLLLAPSMAIARVKPWFLGTWRSDPDLSTFNFASRGLVISGEAATRRRQMFAHITHQFTTTEFVFVDYFPEQVNRVSSTYRVTTATSSSVTIEFLDDPLRRLGRTLTMYRTDPHYFVRSGDNLEYFRREA
jgi:hypothetical protein